MQKSEIWIIVSDRKIRFRYNETNYDIDMGKVTEVDFLKGRTMEDRLYKKLEAYGKSDFYPFHMPGHKRNPLAVEGDFPVESDITEIDGFDNLHHAEDILKRAQEDVARLYGVPESFYSINGSSGAILAAVSAAVDKGGQILVARNCHKAVYHAIYLRELSATYIYPHEDPKLGINGGISPGRVTMVCR